MADRTACGGFTLLELVIANVIAVILLGSVLISLRIINQHQQQTRAAAASVNPSRDPHRSGDSP